MLFQVTACGLWLTLGQLGIPVSVYDEVGLHVLSYLMYTLT